MMKRVIAGMAGVGLLASAAAAGVGPETAQKIYEEATPALVAVQYTWDSELGRRELAGAGVVVAEDGMVIAPINLFPLAIPDDQMKEFKVIVPRLDGEPEELDAEFLGRDERSNLAFIRPVESRPWKAIEFEEAPVAIGEAVMSVGLLPKSAGYRSFFAESTVSARLRGEVPTVLVGGSGLTAVGSPVFNADGQAVGLIMPQPEQQILLNDPRVAMATINNPPRFFVPAGDFLFSLQDPPAGEPLRLPWVGIPQLTGLRKDVAEFFDIEDQPAVEVGDVIPGSPAETAGLKRGHIIIRANGEALERGEDAEEVPAIFRRKLLRMKPGDTIVFSVLERPGEPLKEIEVQTGEMPRRPNMVRRYFVEDLGFSAREVTFFDTYQKRLPEDTPGVVVGLIRPQSAAQTAGLQPNDLITSMNREAVTDLERFQQEYEALRQQNPREAIVLVVVRDANTHTLRIEPPQ